ncbi:hypothetical protein MNV49_007698 [Pseudohyphozyma bogoriensis]|nr:hypothetical protein MNV49_007698 [Pseudohyphozyma bogoriensis]
MAHAWLVLLLGTLLLASSSAKPDPSCSPVTNTKLSTCFTAATRKAELCKVPPVATASFSQNKAKCLCAAWQAMADCWTNGSSGGVGELCEQWHPLQVEADQMCALARRTKASSKTFRRLLKEAQAVSTAIVQVDAKGRHHLPHVTNSIDHTYRPPYSHQRPSRPTKKRPLGVQEPHDDPVDADTSVGILSIQTTETLFEFLELDDEDEEILLASLPKAMRS